MKKAIFIAVIISIAAAVTAACVFLKRSPVPENVTVFLESSSEIITVSYRDYIIGCVFGMISPQSEREALKSAACAANTMALYLLEHRSGFSNSGADFSSSEYSPMMYIPPAQAQEIYGKSYQRYFEKVSAAVDCGMKYAITCSGKPIYAATCLLSTGKTDSSDDLPYLSSVSAACDTESAMYTSSRTFTEGMLRSSLGRSAAELPADCESWFSDAEYTENGTLKQIRFGGALISGEELMQSLGLWSTAIRIEYTESRFVFTCRGYGTNLGMSLNAANVLAGQGMKMTDILMYFYPETKLSVL